MNRPEILAPAGGREQLMAAVRCGADAVYLGGGAFNARRNAENFGPAELSSAASYCRRHGVKLYVTMNTVVLDRELPALEAAAEAVAEVGADGVILQDMAALELFRARYPSIHRVASTQTAVHDADGAKFLQDAGFDSFVLARELSLDEMADILNAVDIPAEAFVHGAHCMSVSGMCELSAMLGGRSGNRGLCAQPCRLNWTCGGSGSHVLSLKDLSLVRHIPALAAAGVATLKIEGRMKRPEYVAAAVTACRAARDGEPFDTETLRAVFSRSGFTDGYLTGRLDREMFGYRTRADVTDAAEVLKPLRALYHKEQPRVPLSLFFSLDGTGCALTVSDGEREVRVAGPAPEPARARALEEASAAEQLRKTGGTQYYVNSIVTKIAPGYSLPVAALNALRRQGLEALDDLRGQAPPAPRGAWEPARLSRRESRVPAVLWGRFFEPDQMPEALPERVLVPLHKITPALLERCGGRLIAELPALRFPGEGGGTERRLAALRDGGLAGAWADNIHGLELCRRLGVPVHGGFGLNVTNSEALLFYTRRGLESVTASFELPLAEARRLGAGPALGLVVYGHLPLMRYRSCPIRAQIGCKACGGQGSLTDRLGVRFPVECWEKRFSTLLNSVPLSIPGRALPADFGLLWFTRESRETCADILARFHRGEQIPAAHTGGLYTGKLL